MDELRRPVIARLQSPVHEPRIRDPRVSLVRTDTLARSLRFHVEGKLILENSEEDISFDTLFEVTSGEYQVK